MKESQSCYSVRNSDHGMAWHGAFDSSNPLTQRPGLSNRGMASLCELIREGFKKTSRESQNAALRTSLRLSMFRVVSTKLCHYHYSQYCHNHYCHYYHCDHYYYHYYYCLYCHYYYRLYCHYY